MYIIWAILAFGLLIIVHELGHFIMAKVNGVYVEEFSIGMGPKIFTYKGKETAYSLGIFPIGGYVKMLGEEENVDDDRSLSSKSPIRRISIVVAGAIMNFLLAIVIFTATLSNNGFKLPVANEVSPNSPASIAGIEKGDEFVKIDGSPVLSADDLTVGIAMSKGEEVDVVVKRNGEKVDLRVKPEFNEKEQRYMVGFTFGVNAEPTIFESFKQSFKQTGSLVVQTFKGLKMIVTGEANLKTDVGGPVTIIKMSGEAAKNGIWNLLYFTAFISVNLAVFNMLPFPALDGGWTILILIEMITRRKVPDKIVNVINYIGFAFLIGLTILVTIKDILFPVNF
ncbi:MAG: RIP metalloprotease RseP [Clostridium sp.]